MTLRRPKRRLRNGSPRGSRFHFGLVATPGATPDGRSLTNRRAGEREAIYTRLRYLIIFCASAGGTRMKTL